MKLAKRLLSIALVFFALTAQAFDTTATIAFGTVTGSYATAITVAGNARQLHIVSSLDQDVKLKFATDAGEFTVAAGNVAHAIQLADFGVDPSSPSVVVQIKHTGVAPTTGSITLNTTK